MTAEKHRGYILPFVPTRKAFLAQHCKHFTILPPTAVGSVLHLLYFDLTRLCTLQLRTKNVVLVINFITIRLQTLTTMKERKQTLEKKKSITWTK